MPICLYELLENVIGTSHACNHFLVKMQTLDNIIVDFTPPIHERFLKNYQTRFRYEALSSPIIKEGERSTPTPSRWHEDSVVVVPFPEEEKGPKKEASYS